MSTLSLPQLSLNLPSSRVSVDFATFAVDLSALSTSSQEGALNFSSTNKPLPLLRKALQHSAYSFEPSLSGLKEEKESATTSPSRQPNWQRRNIVPESSKSSIQTSPALSRTNSSSSTTSTSSTYVSSVFSRARSASTGRSSPALSYGSSEDLRPHTKGAARLSSLPLSLLEHITSYALDLPSTVSIGPVTTPHMQYRYHRESLHNVELRQIVQHPLFHVSHRIREVALDVFYRKCDFAIDLSSIYYTKVSSTINSNRRKHQKFWNDPSNAVKETLRNLSRLQIRLPVPSTEAGAHRGRENDDWMDGGDGKGGGNWKVKSMKKEQEDAQEIEQCLDTIVELLMTAPGNGPEPSGFTRSLSSLSLRRTKSFRSERSKTPESSRSYQVSGPDAEATEDDKRKPLKRLEIVLVKRSPWALVLPESLALIRALRSVPVTGFTKYYFELNGQKVIWATKYRKKWQGAQPDGPRLLRELQGLTIAEPPIEPICTPTEFKFVQVDKAGRGKASQLRLVDSALPKTPIVFEAPKRSNKDAVKLSQQSSVPKAVRRKPIAKSLFNKKSHKRNDSFGFVMDEGMSEPTVIGKGGKILKGKKAPPTVDELKQIAEDIRNGLY